MKGEFNDESFGEVGELCAPLWTKFCACAELARGLGVTVTSIKGENCRMEFLGGVAQALVEKNIESDTLNLELLKIFVSLLDYCTIMGNAKIAKLQNVYAFTCLDLAASLGPG